MLREPIGPLHADKAMITEEIIWTHLQSLQDPMFGEPLSVVDVGLVHEVRLTGSAVYVTILMFNRGRVLIDAAASPIRQHLLQLEGVTEATVEVLWQPPWTPDRLSPLARQALGFTEDDPPEGRMHVRAQTRARGDEMPVEARHLEASRLQLGHALMLQDLPRDKFRQWWGGWRYYRRFTVAERSGRHRCREPVLVDVEFTAGQVDDCAREIRIVDEASAQEIPCQIYREASDGDGRTCSVLFMADTEAHGQKTYLLLHGNPSPACWPRSSSRRR